MVSAIAEVENKCTTCGYKLHKNENIKFILSKNDATDIQKRYCTTLNGKVVRAICPRCDNELDIKKMMSKQ